MEIFLLEMVLSLKAACYYIGILFYDRFLTISKLSFNTCGGGIFSDNADGGGGGGLDGRPFLDTKAPTGVDESSEEQSLGRFHGDKHVWVSISWTSFNGDNLLQLGSSFLIMRRIYMKNKILAKPSDTVCLLHLYSKTKIAKQPCNFHLR